MDAERPIETPLTVHQVAERFGVADKTVRRWLNDGTLKGIRFGRWGRWHVPLPEIERVLGEKR